MLTNSITDPPLLQLFLKKLQKLYLIATCQHPISFFPCQFDHLLDPNSVIVNQPRTDNQQSSALSCMTMHTDFPPVSQTHLEQVHDPHHMFKGSTGHIFPTLVEAVNPVPVKVLRNVAEPSIRDDSVPTVRMLSRFLQVQHCSDVLFLEFFVDVELLYQPFGRPLHGQDVFSDPVRIQPLNRIRQHLVTQVVLVLTGLSPTELTQENSFFVELLYNKLPQPRPQSRTLLSLHIIFKNWREGQHHCKLCELSSGKGDRKPSYDSNKSSRSS